MKYSYIIMTAIAVSMCFVGAYAEKKVIAHRGASGYLPEHTLASYTMAYAMGADYLEPDLAVSKDGVLVCLHDMTLEEVTNAKEVFPDRARADGKWYAVDFTLAELKQLYVMERTRGRFPREARLFQIPTFEEMIQLTQGLNASTGRNVGIYPELKDPIFYEKAGFAFAEMMLEVLAKYGYEGPDANVYIQCFFPDTLIRLRKELGVTLPCIQLLSGNKLQDSMVSDEGLDKIASYAQGIGPEKKRITDDPTLVKRAHDRGLQVHPYTFRKEAVPKNYETLEEELHAFFVDYDIDAGFADQPDIMRKVIDSIK